MAYKTFLITTILSLLSVHLSAQIIPSIGEDESQSDARVGSHYSLLPVVGYSSDSGFFGGGLIQRIDYGNNVRPFLSNLEADLTFSTKGNVVSAIEHEHTKIFGSDIRSRVVFVGQRIQAGHYFGIGNQTDYSDDLFDEKYYYFENRELFFELEGRKTVWRFGENGIFDLLGTGSMAYVNGLTRGEESKYAADTPRGFGKTRINKLGFGIVADSRDSEFAPTRGIRYQATLKSSLRFLGSDYTYSTIRLDMRNYRQLFDGVVLAQKLEVESISGKAPFWDLTMIGSRSGLRGFHEDRFRGDHAILNLLELRTWLFSLIDEDLRFGGQLFWDSGRVFSDVDSNQIFDNWNHVFGVGGIMTFFNPDLMFRADLAFSNETYRLNFGAGYIF